MMFKPTFTHLAAYAGLLVSLCASMAAFAQYNPNIQNNAGNGMMDNATPYNPAPYNPVAATGSGYTNDGTLMIGGQKIGNPHQILHDLNVPSFFGVNANRLSFSDVPSYGQGTLAQMENHTLTIGVPAGNVVLSRLYLTPTNPYVEGVATPHNNYQTYQGVVAAAQAGSYQLTVANDNKLYAFKTLGSMSTQSQNILIKELPAHSVFIANSDPKGGATAVRVTQNGDYAAMQNYFDTVKPYDFSWRQGFGEYGNNWNNAVQSNNFNSFANSPKFDSKSWEDFLATVAPRNSTFMPADQYFGYGGSGNAFVTTNFNDAEQTDLYEKIWGSALKRVAPPIVVYYTGSTILNKQTYEQQLETARQLQTSWNQTFEGVKSWWNNLTESRGSRDSELGTNRPKDAPPGTIGIDQWGNKHGWDKDRLHGEKEDATGPGRHGEAWVGVAPNGEVGINSNNRWNPQGKVDPKEGQKESGESKSETSGGDGSSDGSSSSESKSGT